MQSLAHGTVVSIEFLDHAFDLFAKTGIVEVDIEDVSTALELFQATVVLISLANLEGCYDGLQFCQHGVG